VIVCHGSPAIARLFNVTSPPRAVAIHEAIRRIRIVVRGAVPVVEGITRVESVSFVMGCYLASIVDSIMFIHRSIGTLM
jgi:hypothetical protein